MYKTIFASLGLFSLPLTAQTIPQFEVDPYWPGALPAGWINATLGHPCVDSHDHIAVLDRQNITGEEAETSVPAASIMLFDTDGNLVDSWGDSTRVPDSIHGCAFDADDNIWVVGNNDGIAQKYSHAGELLFQIGTLGVLDTHDGTAIRADDNSINREPLNAGRDRLFFPAGVAIDPENGDAYIADGYGNKRIAVFDEHGQYLRQWGRQALHRHQQRGPSVRLRSRRAPRPGVRQDGKLRPKHLGQDRQRILAGHARHRLGTRILN